MIDWITKEFSELTNEELYSILKLRIEVFIIEQKSIFLDLDDADQTSIHFFATECGKLLAYARVSINSAQFSATISRVVTHQSAREKKLGTLLMNQALNYIAALKNIRSIELDAQLHLKKFYEKFGFQPVGKPFDDAGILHIHMTK